jgi:hypothetical protein
MIGSKSQCMCGAFVPNSNNKDADRPCKTGSSQHLVVYYRFGGACRPGAGGQSSPRRVTPKDSAADQSISSRPGTNSRGSSSYSLLGA